MIDEATPIEQIQLEIDNLQTKIHIYLCQKGWKYTGDNPGAIWLWAITRNGVEYRVNQSAAEHCQIEWDSQELEEKAISDD